MVQEHNVTFTNSALPRQRSSLTSSHSQQNQQSRLHHGTGSPLKDFLVVKSGAPWEMLRILSEQLLTATRDRALLTDSSTISYYYWF